MPAWKKSRKNTAPVLDYQAPPQPTPPDPRNGGIFEYFEWKDGVMIVGGVGLLALPLFKFPSRSLFGGICMFAGMVLVVVGQAAWSGRRPWW